MNASGKPAGGSSHRLGIGNVSAAHSIETPGTTERRNGRQLRRSRHDVSNG